MNRRQENFLVVLIATVILTIVVTMWILSQCTTIDWMTVDITVHGGVKTVTTTEWVPVCIPNP